MTSRSFLVVVLAALAACSHSSSVSQSASPAPAPAQPAPTAAADPRVGLKAGQSTAGEAIWNARLLSSAPKANSGAGFNSATNSDLAFTGKYAVQGNYHGFLIYDLSNPSSPTLVSSFVCPASQNDVSVYKQQLLFMSAEAPSARLDCGIQGVTDSVSAERMRGIRIFDITDIRNPKYITSVQTCRGSHTHTVLVDPKDRDNVYIYVSGSSGVRSPNELSGCTGGTTDSNPATAQFRVEIIRIPLANPAAAAIANGARIFENMGPAGPRHGDAPADILAAQLALAGAKAGNGFVMTVGGREQVMPGQVANRLLDSIATARGGAGTRTRADSVALRAAIPRMTIAVGGPGGGGGGRPTGPNQCHDITLYPEAGIGGGACQGYGILLDIRDPINPKRITAATDTTNMTAWHSVTFNNDGTKILWSDEWGGGSTPKCRADDPKEWGANAIFSIENGNQLKFRSYYKIAAAQTAFENCVAHNGSLIPIPGRDVMIQGWYQGGISVFDWTDPDQVKEIAYFDRGPVDSTRLVSGGSWSAYWYNGNMYSSEIARGFDVVELTPSEFISENELIAAKSVVLPYFNPQGQPKLVWPPSFALACSYLDQLQRSNGLGAGRISSARAALARAEAASGDARRTALTALAGELNADAMTAMDAPKVRKLAGAVTDLVGAQNPVGCSRSIS
ncbi:MAG: hypothetical protein EXR93_01135 [Gemmatimonadetes bacterium]|nr:hypothetical protein [Gemmatimonadota bacterium]